MSLPNSIAEDAARLLKDLDGFSLWLTELKRLNPPVEERSVEIYTNARTKIMDMRADVRGILSSVQADRLTGQASTQVPVPPHLADVPDEVEARRVASARGWRPEIGEPAPSKPRRNRHRGHAEFDWAMAAANDHSNDPDEDEPENSDATQRVPTNDPATASRATERSAA